MTDEAPKNTLVDQALAAAHRYLRAERVGAVGPDAKQVAALDAFGQVSLDDPIGATRAIELLDESGSPATMRSTGGRYFGFVNGGVTPEALAASILASAWDQNVALPAMSPVGSAIDTAAAAMILDVLELPTTATAAFCAGATIANITGIVTGRDALYQRAGYDLHAEGLVGAPPIEVIVSEEAHVSVHKALRVAGFGQNQVTIVPADRYGCLDADQLPALDGPTLVLLQAGNVNTGHSDPFDQIIARVAGPNTWVHVDGAFGLWANAVPARRALVAGVELADSWATDGHKWLNAPYDCGVFICADGTHLQHSMHMHAAYVPSGTDERSLMNLGMQMSQAARAVPIWATLATRGRHGIADAIEHACQCAERFGQQLSQAGAELLAPVVLNQALLAFGDHDTTDRADREATDRVDHDTTDRVGHDTTDLVGHDTTDRVVEAVQRDGTCWVGATTWQGRRAMRISVSDMSTTFDDVDRSVQAILGCWRGL